jgi:hypothetical protein
LLYKEFGVAVDVLFELADGFHGEGVRDCLAFAGVFGTVAGVEETAADRDEGVIEVAVEVVSIIPGLILNFCISGLVSLDSRVEWSGL